MKSEEPALGVEIKKPAAKTEARPDAYAFRRGRSGWTLSRRSVLNAAAAAAATPKRAEAAACAEGALAPRNCIWGVAIGPDGRLLASTVYDSDCPIKLWSLPDGALLKTLTGNLAPVFSVAISPDGRLLASGGSDNTKLWSLPDGAQLKTLSTTATFVHSIAISPDGRLLVSGGAYGSDNDIELWSLPDGARLKTPPQTGNNNPPTTFAISPDRRLLASGSGDKALYGRGCIKLWSLPDCKELPVCFMDPAASPPSVNGARYTKDGGTYTLPCGSPIPAGAVCTCNCVPGTACSCVSDGGGGGGGHYWYPN